MPEEKIIPLNDGTSELVTVVIVHSDRPEYLSLTLQSVALFSMNNNTEIVVVDNGSKKQSSLDFLDMVDKEPSIRVHRNERNEWWTAAANAGAKLASPASKYLIFLHHDVVILNPAWIDLLISVAESNGSGLVSTDSFKWMIGTQEHNTINDWCMLVSRDCWAECGPFEPRLRQSGSSFFFAIKANSKGYKPLIAKKELMIAHHCRAASVDYSQGELFDTEARSLLPRLIASANSVPVG